jgi:predicted DsbA family dithiol-disulfide isomerase
MHEHFAAEVTWAAFDLHPEYPPDGLLREQLVARYGPEGMERTRALFEQNGFVYNPNPDVVPNSMNALRLAEHARGQGLFDEMHARLMDAYWAEAQDIGDPDVLRRLAEEVGLEEAEEVIAGDAYLELVRGSTAQAVAAGVTGVPAFVLDQRLLVLGAHPRETFERAFAQLDSERST